jgi:hypothetical protein
MNTIYLNLVNRVTNVNYTFDLTEKILNDIRKVKHDFTQPELGGMVYKCLKSKDVQRAARALTMYLLKSQNWKIGKSMGLNCFNYYIDNGVGIGYIKALHTISVDSHEEAHAICGALDNEVETIHN